MIKSALQYIVGLNTPYITEIGDRAYSDKLLHRIDKYIPKAAPLALNTLTGLVDYIKSNTDLLPEKMLVIVESPTCVVLASDLDMNRDREILIEVNAELPNFDFGRFITHEPFIIGVQAKFVDTGDKALVLQFAGTVESGTVAEYDDDGITQKATVKQGLVSKSTEIVPNPVVLAPYRTFHEVEQPISSFVFRMRDAGMAVGVECALIEADGGAWRNTAKQNVKEYLAEQLKEFDNITVIA